MLPVRLLVCKTVRSRGLRLQFKRHLPDGPLLLCWSATLLAEDQPAGLYGCVRCSPIGVGNFKQKDDVDSPRREDRGGSGRERRQARASEAHRSSPALVRVSFHVCLRRCSWTPSSTSTSYKSLASSPAVPYSRILEPPVDAWLRARARGKV